MYFVIDSHVNSTKDGHTNRKHTLYGAHNRMMQHWRNDNGETRVNCNFEVRITDKCDNLGLGSWVAVPVMASCLCTVTVTTQCYSILNANAVLRSRMLMNGPLLNDCSMKNYLVLNIAFSRVDVSHERTA